MINNKLNISSTNNEDNNINNDIQIKNDSNFDLYKFFKTNTKNKELLLENIKFIETNTKNKKLLLENIKYSHEEKKKSLLNKIDNLKIYTNLFDNYINNNIITNNIYYNTNKSNLYNKIKYIDVKFKKLVSYYNSINYLFDCQINLNLFNTKNIFIISNIISGGVNKYLYDLFINYNKYNINFILLRDNFDLKQYKNIIKKNDIIILQHFIDTDFKIDDISKLIEDYELQLIITIHDNYYLNSNDFYTYTTDNHILINNKISSNFSKLFDHAQKIIFPTKYIYDVFSSNTKYLNKMYLSNHIDKLYYDKNLYIPIISSNKINIGIITEISKYKGEELLLELFNNKTTHKNYKIIFNNFNNYKVINNKNIVNYKNYVEDEIYDLLNNNNIHGLIFLNKWPETYSYALTKGINSKLPIFYTNIGAVGERLKLYNNERFISNDDTKNLFTDFNIFLDFIINNNEIGEPFNFNKFNKYNENTFYNDLLLKNNNATENNNKIIHNKIKPFAIYFPQFHETEENNINFYKGFTDFTNLKKIKKNNDEYLTPLKGILDYYDLEKNNDIIPEQINIAKNYGFYGFAIYYYWFSTNTITNKNMIFDKVINKFFENPIKDFKIFFVYANENWTDNVAFKSNNSENHSIINIYNKTNITNNINNLLKYFKNDNYYKINNKPVFLIHHSFVMTDSEINLFYNISNEILIINGFDGIELCLNCIGKKYENYSNYFHHCDYKTVKQHTFVNFDNNNRYLDYDKYINDYLPSILNIDNNEIINTCYTYFDNTPRFLNHRNSNIYTTKTINHNLKLFEKFIDFQFNKYLNKDKEINKIFIINAWNEWGEQMCLEPSNELGYSYLKIFYNKLVEKFII